ncbi:MAG: asparaginase [Anaerolineae bacterium]|jgi:L-asparaginase
MSHPKKRVVILTTGGTIAMQHDASLGGATPKMGADDFAVALPANLLESVTLESAEIVNLPSSHFGLDTLWQIRQAVVEAVIQPQIDGVVITHGTDVMEETAMLLDLTVDRSKPVVLTGAMRTATQVGYEGFANLAAAVRVAASPQARDLGTLVVMNDEVHAARFVTKTHTLSVDTFRSPAWGPIGRVEGERVRIGSRVTRHNIPCPALETRVELIKLTVGAGPAILGDMLARGVRGVVIEALGGGRIPPWWFPAIQRAIAAGVMVVAGSRCPSGRVWDDYGYPGALRDAVAAGCLLAEGLNGPKARIKLMVVLGAATEQDEIELLWYAGIP